MEGPTMTLFDATPPNACAAYTNLRKAKDGWQLAGRGRCEELWRDYEPYADASFVAEFPAHLHERWFEMYLTVALRSGLSVSCPKVKTGGPDILVTTGNGGRVWIESHMRHAGRNWST
jgi:hypothetical protein